MRSLLTLTLTVVMVTGGAYGDFQVLEGDSLSTFLLAFRQVLLEKVAFEVNVTIGMTDLLAAEVDKCKPLITTKVTECKACAKSNCKEEPDFLDYLTLANPYLYMKEPLDNIGNQIDSAIDLLGEGAAGFYNSLKEVGSFYGDEETYKKAFERLNAVLNLDEIANFFKDLWDSILNLDDFASDIWGDIFGKRRRRSVNLETRLRIYRILKNLAPKLSQRSTELDPELRECMEQKCASCQPLLKPTKEEIVTAVCGDTIATLNATIMARVLKMQTVYNYTLDKVTPIVSKLELDPASYNFVTGIVADVYITAYIQDAYKRYKTGVEYSPLNVGAAARSMGIEYWRVFDE